MRHARAVSDLSRGRLGPFSPVVDARIQEDGADDGVGRDRNAVHAIHQVFEHESQILFAPAEESGGMRVAINGRIIWNLKWLAMLMGLCQWMKSSAIASRSG